MDKEVDHGKILVLEDLEEVVVHTATEGELGVGVAILAGHQGIIGLVRVEGGEVRTTVRFKINMPNTHTVVVMVMSP